MNEKQAELEVYRLYPEWRRRNPHAEKMLFYSWLQTNYPAVANFRPSGLEKDP